MNFSQVALALSFCAVGCRTQNDLSAVKDGEIVGSPAPSSSQGFSVPNPRLMVSTQGKLIATADSGVDVSEDDGVTWSFKTFDADLRFSHPHDLYADDHVTTATFAKSVYEKSSRGFRDFYYAVSEDAGKTWQVKDFAPVADSLGLPEKYLLLGVRSVGPYTIFIADSGVYAVGNSITRQIGSASVHGGGATADGNFLYEFDASRGDPTFRVLGCD
jgi:hypothetical protein